MQLVPAIHGGDPDPTAALPEKLAAGGSGEDLWIAGASVLQSHICSFITLLLLFFVLGFGATS